jgi:putative transposase
MSQSLTQIYVHIVFSTKYREHRLHESVQPELFHYLKGIIFNLDSYPIEVGGVTDHIHILVNVSKKMPLSKLVQEIKANSSRWLKTKGSSLYDFSWQNGYGAFSVNPADVHIVSRYIRTQKEHHQQKSFKNEFVEFLIENKIQYDERYLWD